MTPQEFKGRRKGLRMSHNQLAAVLGLDSNGDVHLREIESGKRTPSGPLLKCLEYYELLQKKHKALNLIKANRLEKGVGLIEFCERIGCTPNEWNKLQDFS